ncbi:hypothetical protein QQZ08_001125 [Neonectria magnoliae]|uniref:Uncharacterized protein n=1 Tax=Neonectria magnoliae TaxID=2732573 RepID=A0ABR1IEW1_9HYPO
MAQKAVQLRPKELNSDFRELNEYLEKLIGHPVPSTRSLPPIFFFVTSEENVEKLKEHYGDKVIITVHDVDE